MSGKPQIILDLEVEASVWVRSFKVDSKKEIYDLDLRIDNKSDLGILSQLPKLSHLSLIGNNLVNTKSLSKITSLFSLDLSFNRLVDISDLSHLTNLVELRLNKNKLSNISSLSNLTNLSILNLSENNISSIRALSVSKNLSILYLNGNQISNLRPLYNLEKLIELDLTKNKISDISALSNLDNLINLGVGLNFINDFSELSKLSSLKNLDLRRNHINNPRDITELHNIEKIFFEDRETFTSYRHGFDFGLNLFGNPLEKGIIDVIKSGGKDSLNKYLDAKDRSQVRIPEAKMVLLGEPRAGKTTLQKYLMGLQIDENEESTPDIQISSWKPFELDSNAQNKDIKINLWDFGGQEIQYSLHKLFMTEDTLYIIVLDSTKDQSPLKYLKFLENYAPNSPFIIINNYGDAPTSNSLKIDENYLRENYNGKDGMPVLKAIFNRVSILKAAKLDPSFRKIMDEVEVTIKNELLNLKNLNKEFPKEYQLVKSAIEQEYSKPDKHYITMSYYRELCKSLKITDDEDLRTAILGYLNEIGVLRYFKDSPITDKHILNPKWLIDGAYSLIIDEETANNFGVLSKSQARNILKRSKKGFKFEEEESEFIFKTMKFYGLLHSDENEQKVYIPLRFKSLQPTTLLDFYENGKHFAFEFKSDIPEEIISNLIVKHFEEIPQHYYWSKGAVFENNRVRILVKVEDRNIHFYIQGQYHQSYFEILRRTLRKSLERLPGLGYEEIVEFELNGKKIRVVYEYLLNVLTDKLGHYYDHATKTKIDENEIVKILGGYFSLRQIEQITNITNNNFYGDFNDNRYQQITIIQELNSLVQLAQNVDDRKALEEIRSEIQLLNQTNEVEKKESLSKKLLGKIKKLSTDSLDDVVKDKLKELFPKIVEKGIDWIEKVDFDGIMQIFGGIL
jgi:internalin A